MQFKVKFTDESFKYMTNTELRKNYPLKLLDFYENNVQISFKWSYIPHYLFLQSLSFFRIAWIKNTA